MGNRRMMELEKWIGIDFEQIKAVIGPYSIGNNDFELELEEGVKETFYVTAKNELVELILTTEKRVQTIFINPNKEGEFSFKDFIVDMDRAEVRKRFGTPSKSGGPFSSPILGDNGGFDRFDKEIAYHFEYLDKNQTQLKRITLMSLDAAP